MATAPKRPDDELPRGMDVEAFLAWVKGRPGRFELHGGEVVAMAPERLEHVEVKTHVQVALRDGVKKANLDCRGVGDGIAVHVSDLKWYQPDALVYCGPRAPRDATRIDNASIVVEVSSPSTSNIDEQQKLVGYFSVPSVQHYLIIYPDKPILHHQRQLDGSILTKIMSAGTLRLDPPGIEIDVATLFE